MSGLRMRSLAYATAMVVLAGACAGEGATVVSGSRMVGMDGATVHMLSPAELRAVSEDFGLAPLALPDEGSADDTPAPDPDTGADLQ